MRKYPRRGLLRPRPGGVLDRRRLDRVLEYIEAHIDAEHQHRRSCAGRLSKASTSSGVYLRPWDACPTPISALARRLDRAEGSVYSATSCRYFPDLPVFLASHLHQSLHQGRGREPPGRYRNAARLQPAAADGRRPPDEAAGSSGLARPRTAPLNGPSALPHKLHRRAAPVVCWGSTSQNRAAGRRNSAVDSGARSGEHRGASLRTEPTSRAAWSALRAAWTTDRTSRVLSACAWVWLFRPISTAPFRDGRGGAAANSIAVVERWPINGIDQSVIIRGRNRGTDPRRFR